jgi:hypothetical protein
MSSNSGFPKGTINRSLTIEGSDTDTDIITSFIINEYGDHVPILNEAVISGLKENTKVKFKYNRIAVGADMKELVAASIIGEENIKALLIGIDTYAKNAIRGSVSGLCKLENVLINKFGYFEEDIKKLINEEATKNAISFYLTKLINEAKDGDKLIVFFSGHGTYNNNANGRMEGICPFDFDPNASESSFSEKDLKDLFKKIEDKNIKLLLICDSCYSGGILDQDPSFTCDDSFGNKVTILSSCSRVRYAHSYLFDELDYYGAFTYILVKNLENITINRSLGNLMDRVISEIKELNLAQIPRILGDSHQSIASIF